MRDTIDAIAAKANVAPAADNSPIRTAEQSLQTLDDLTRLLADESSY